MTRTLKALSALVLGGMLLISTACEDKECKEALAKSTTAAEAAAKAQGALVADLNATKAKLAATTAELAKVKADVEAAKAAAPKAEEPAPAAPAKKGKKK
jgi:pyruvate dehydrogenase complex dehydrogenase (E1) component